MCLALLLPVLGLVCSLLIINETLGGGGIFGVLWGGELALGGGSNNNAISIFSGS